MSDVAAGVEGGEHELELALAPDEPAAQAGEADAATSVAVPAPRRRQS